MKVANICPTDMLEAFIDKHETYHLILSSLVVGDPRYAAFYKERCARGDFVILDNDAHEMRHAQQVQKIDMIRRAWDILEKPSEVVLPDRFGSGKEETITLANEGLTAFKSDGRDCRYMIVPRGLNYAEYLDCVDEVTDMDDIWCVGIYENAAIEHDVPRAQMLKEVDEILGLPGMDIHLLGMMEDMTDLMDPEVVRRCRGVDSCKLIRWGLDGFNVFREYVPPYPGRGPNFFARPLSDVSGLNRQIVQANMRYWRAYVDAPR